MKVAREWVYLAAPQIFRHLESGNSLRRIGFNDTFASCCKGPLDRMLFSGSFIKIFQDVDYVPTSEGREVSRDGLQYLNSYLAPDVVAQEGDARPFLDFLAYLVPDEEERAHLLKMIAWTVRHPGRKLRHALLLRSARQGIGKSMLIDIWSRLIGEKNVRKTTTEEISGQYQGYIKETLLVVLEELNWGFGPSGYNRLKDLITGDVATVNEKYVPVRSWPNHATFVILTNVPLPMMIEENDRRIFMIDSPAEPRPKEYYSNFAVWLQSNLGVIRACLDQVDLEEFNPHAPPPMTAAKRELIANAKDPLVQDLAALIDNRVGIFQRDIVTFAQIERELGTAVRYKTRNDVKAVLANIGAVALGQHRVPGRWVDGFFLSGGGRENLWAIRHVEYWREASPTDRAQEYARAVGILAPYDPRYVFVRHAKRWPGGQRTFLEQFERG